MKVKRNHRELRFDVADNNDRVVYTLHCVNNAHFYCINYAISRCKTFAEVQELLKEVKDANAKKG